MAARAGSVLAKIKLSNHSIKANGYVELICEDLPINSQGVLRKFQ